MSDRTTANLDNPFYLSSDTHRWIKRARLTRIWGHLNVYTCETCGSQTVTTDLDEGTTPFLIRCPDCQNGMAKSAMYRISSSFTRRPTHAWYRPADLVGLSPGEEDHVVMGGLLLRELTVEERAVFEEPTS